MSEGSILVVSREPSIARALRITLEAKGYEVTNLDSVDDVIKRSSRNDDLVLLDNDTSALSATAACREIRACSDIAIIILSGENSEEKKAHAISAGADAYILKPFGVEEVFARVQASLPKVRITVSPGTLAN
jgi:two-component system, OmpR family, KDP operon response regulator KdpE